MFSNDLLNILACPTCKGSLLTEAEAQKLLCKHCGLEFKVRDGIPVMLVEDATESM